MAAAICFGAGLLCVSQVRGGNPGEKSAIEHATREIEGWTVEIDTRLLAGKHADFGRQALRILGNKLYEITLVVPENRVAKLRQLPIRIDFDHPLRNMQYHPSAGWLREHGYDPGLEKTVHIPRAAGLVAHQRNYTQPWSVLHELAHAYHDRFLGFDYDPVRRAYRRAKASGHYESVRHINGKKRKHYALTNHKEFFAEMSEACLGTNDFYPFVRGELRACDPETYVLLKSIWTDRHAAPAVAGQP